MKAARYTNFKDPLELVAVSDPVPGNNDVVLEVKCTGLCLSDWHGWMGHDPDITLPHIPGHEMAGVVVEVGKSIKRWKPGDRVTLPFVCGCGECKYCIEGNPQVCDHQFQPGFTHWGSFAPYIRIKYADYNLVSMPEFLDYQTAAILGCRFATSFRAVVDRGEVQPGQWVAVYGCGGVGLSAIMIACALGARVIAVDLEHSKLSMAKVLGAECLISGSGDECIERIIEISDGGAHLSLDAVGKNSIIQDAIKSLRKLGRHVQVGLLDPEEKKVLLPFDEIIAHELQLMGSHGMQASRYHEMMALIEKGTLNPGRLITQQISLAASLTALTQLNTKTDPGITVINDFTS